MAENTTSQGPALGNALLGELDIHWLEWGERGRPVALCVHGFPDTPQTFRHLGPVLAEAGFHVVAPWLRGYAPSAVPADGNYRVGTLVGDVVGLVDHLGADDAVLVGHDWGAIIGYATVALHPERF
ncbi:MAG TPA: alpha/beta fold hydrolase, partial [Acidimicrobiales bacterium]|nr:alpha/beta fold hydrolase [Acidimicrobiales bacterium]